MKLKIGSIAPQFILPDQTGKKRAFADYRGKWVLLYFYPRDNTPGCAKEACGIRDNFPKFCKMKTKILGISADSVKSHENFSVKYRLPFILLADEGKEVVKKYGVYVRKKLMGREYMGVKRTSFLIDPQGKIAKIYENVKPETHAEEVLRDLGSLIK